MMKHEFVSLVTTKYNQEAKDNFQLHDADYEIIEIVYTFHPAVGSKKQIATLFNDFGMIVIQDMLPRAEKVKELESRMQAYKLEVAGIQREIQELSN